MTDFKIPRQPADLFHMPFANEGNKSIIPTDTQQHGRATLAKGFPTETQLPLRQGGVAPNRMDFNGILYMLSAFAFWQQSGGMWLWNEALHYTIPNLVYHKDKLWWCTKESGPNKGGAKEPGATGSEDHWLEFFMALAGMTGVNVNQLFGNPVGTIIIFYGTSAPEGYLPCDGRPFSASEYPNLFACIGAPKTPDLRGQFIRGLNTSNSGTDPNRTLGSIQKGTRVIKDWGFLNNAMGRDALAWGGFETAGIDYDGEPELSYSVNELSYNGRTNIVATAQTWGIRVRPNNTALPFYIKHD